MDEKELTENTEPIPAEEASDIPHGELTATNGEEQTDEAFAEGYDPFREVRELIEKGDCALAREKLDEFEERGAEWYFVQAQLFRKKNWFSECRKSLTTAISLDPQNESYRKMLEELDEAAEQGKRKKKKDKRQMGEDGKQTLAEVCCECGGECVCEALCVGLCEGCCDGL